MSNPEKQLFLDNKLSQQLVVLFIICNTAYTIFHINGMDATFHLGNFIMVNIGLSLLSFLMAVQQKLYQSTWGYLGIAVAIFQIGRLFTMAPEIENPLRLFLQLLVIASGIFLLIGSVICIQRAKKRSEYIRENNIDLVRLQK